MLERIEHGDGEGERLMAMERASALVTGASGFVGSHLAKALLDRGYQVTGLLRPTSDRRHLLDPRLKLVEVGRGDAARLPRLIAEHQLVFHLAGAVRALDYQGFLEANARLTEELLEACLAADPRPRRFILVSTAGASGPPPRGERLTEQHEPRPVTDYGRSKLEGERRALRFADRLRVIILRPSAIYGPRDREMLPVFRLAQRGRLPVFGGPDQIVNLVHVADIVDGITLAAEAPLRSGEVFLLGAAREHTMGEVAEVLATVLRRQVKLLRLPRPVLRSAAWLAEAGGRLRGRPPMLSRQKIPELCASWRLDLQAARERLGYDPRWTLEHGFADALAWYRRAGWIGGRP